MEVDQLAECLDAGDHAGRHVAAAEHRGTCKDV